MSEESRNKSFINRWSTRKQQAGRHEEVVDSAQPSTVQPSREQPLPEQPLPELLTKDCIDFPEPSAQPEGEDRVLAETLDDEPLLSDTDMPPIESLSADSDVSAFFNKGVSAALRKAALRHVFRQPAYNVRDGLNDYDGDYTVFEPLGDTVTSDMKWHIARKERERLEAEARELEQRRLEAENEQESQDLEEAQAEQDSQDPEEAQAEQDSQDLEEAQAEQDSQDLEEAQAEQDSQDLEEAQAEQDSQKPQEPQKRHAEHDAESHSDFANATQIDVDHEIDVSHEVITNTRNKLA